MQSLEHRFRAALDGLVSQVRDDRSILAAVLCGSLAHDTVWAGSDIDLVLVTIDDRKAPAGSRALYVDGVNVHAFLMPRAEFRKAVEGAVRNSFLHSFLAKGHLLYSHDPAIADLCAALSEIGRRDTEIQLLHAAAAAVGPLYKARKWLLTRGDLEYTALFLLYAVTPLARVEVLGARQLAGREVIPQALKLNPGFFRTVYSDLLNARKTPESVTVALDAADAYLASRAPALFAPVLEHLREAGEARSATDIEDHFARNFGVEGVTDACEYLADQGLLGKCGTPVQLTKKSNVQVQELAFFPLSAAPGRDAR